MKHYYVCTYCDKKLYDGDEVYKNGDNELYCSIECLNHCEKIIVSNITCADSHCYWEEEDDDYIEPPTNKQLNLIKAIYDYIPCWQLKGIFGNEIKEAWCYSAKEKHYNFGNATML